MADIKQKQKQQQHKKLQAIYGDNYARVEQATQGLIVSHQQLEQICHLLEEEFKRGLHRDTNAQANIKMYPTHLIDRQAAQASDHFAEPEEGKFLALDLGGTNFRVILLELDDEGQFHMENEVFSLSQELMHGPGAHLFDYIANCLANFVTKRQLQGHCLPLGFTFSFPVQQDSLAHARLVNWTKGFKCPDVEGRDVVGLLREAIERRPDLDIEVMAVVNDTTGTLISCAFKDRECRIGLIVGTGTNACYMEQVNNVHAMHPPASKSRHRQPGNCSPTQSVGDDSGDGSGDNDDDEDDEQDDGDSGAGEHEQHHTVVNTEWGAFGDNGILDFVRTKWDEEIDAHSLNGGRQKFEKMISGLYIGELCRRILFDMAINRQFVFQPPSPSQSSPLKDALNSGESKLENDDDEQNKQHFGQLNEAEFNNGNGETSPPLLAHCERLLAVGPLRRQFSLETRFVSMIESDPVDEFALTRRALNEAFGIDWASDEDCAIVKLVCTRVSTRAAHLVSAAVACLLNRMGRPYTVVGVDGSMFRYHPHFRSIMAKKTQELTRPECLFQLMFSEDGSGKGAAIVASVACKQRRLSAGLQPATPLAGQPARTK